MPTGHAARIEHLGLDSLLLGALKLYRKTPKLSIWQVMRAFPVGTTTVDQAVNSLRQYDTVRAGRSAQKDNDYPDPAEVDRAVRLALGELPLGRMTGGAPEAVPEAAVPHQATTPSPQFPKEQMDLFSGVVDGQEFWRTGPDAWPALILAQEEGGWGVVWSPQAGDWRHADNIRPSPNIQDVISQLTKRKVYVRMSLKSIWAQFSANGPITFMPAGTPLSAPEGLGANANRR